jgi:hypothetical protein
MNQRIYIKMDEILSSRGIVEILVGIIIKRNGQ